MVQPSDDIIKRRLPVWDALSSIFLYPDLKGLNAILETTVRKCRESGYSLYMLEKIYVYEVMPTLQKYVSGWDDNWTGFEPEWLQDKILRYCKGQLVDENFKPTLFQKCRSYWATHSSKKDWELVKSLITDKNYHPSP